jgi:hypothetical protein
VCSFSAPSGKTYKDTAGKSCQHGVASSLVIFKAIHNGIFFIYLYILPFGTECCCSFPFSLEKEQWLPMEKYEIQLSKLPPEVIPISSDEEAPHCSLPTTPKSNSPSPSNSSLAPSAPLQARSLEAIGLAYYRTLSIYSQGRRSTYSSQKRYHRKISFVLRSLNCSY